jgi:Icc-related predicted phosphoesterase
LKITFISDTHTNLYDSTKKHYKELILEKGDILCFSGDIMTSGFNEGELIHFLKWFSKQPFKYKIFIAGNHDRFLENHSSMADEIISKYIEHGVVYLNNSSFEYERLKFYGTPHQPYFFGWAFNVPDSEKLKNIYQQIPDDTDILLTHCPPYGILDKSHEPNYTNPTGENNLGSKELREVLDEKTGRGCKIKIVAFGHIHGDGGKKEKIDDTLYINASLCDERYDPTNEIITIEI